jgi:hypothetical protein
MVSSEQFGFLPIPTKEKWHTERKENHGIKSLSFSLRKTSPFTCCSCLFFFHISLCHLFIPLLNIALQFECFRETSAFHYCTVLAIDMCMWAASPPPGHWARVHVTSFFLRNFIQ